MYTSIVKWSNIDVHPGPPTSDSRWPVALLGGHWATWPPLSDPLQRLGMAAGFQKLRDALFSRHDMDNIEASHGHRII